MAPEQEKRQEEAVKVQVPKIDIGHFVTGTAQELLLKLREINSGNRELALKQFQSFVNVMEGRAKTSELDRLPERARNFLTDTYKILKSKYPWPPGPKTKYVLTPAEFSKLEAGISTGTRLGLMQDLLKINGGDRAQALKQMDALERAVANREKAPDFSGFSWAAASYLRAAQESLMRKTVPLSEQDFQRIVSRSIRIRNEKEKTATPAERDRELERYATRFRFSTGMAEYVVEFPKGFTESQRRTIAGAIRKGKSIAELGMVFGVPSDIKVYLVKEDRMRSLGNLTFEMSERLQRMGVVGAVSVSQLPKKASRV